MKTKIPNVKDAYIKTLAVFDSCKTIHQFLSARKMLRNFYYMYRDVDTSYPSYYKLLSDYSAISKSKILKILIMPDVWMCKGTNCTLKEECYRYKAKPNKYAQSYFETSPYNEELKGCDYFWNINRIKKQ